MFLNFALAKGPKPFCDISDQQGKVPEWSIGAVSKTVVPLRAPRVRIPAFPLKKSCKFLACSSFCMKAVTRFTSGPGLFYKKFCAMASANSCSIFRVKKGIPHISNLSLAVWKFRMPSSWMRIWNFVFHSSVRRKCSPFGSMNI